MVGGALLVSCALLLLTVRINQARTQKQQSLESSESPLHCLPTTTMEGEILLAYVYICQ